MAMPSEALKNLHGIIPPLVTPLLDRDRLDNPGLERLIEHVLAGGVHGIFILGTTGEGPSLSYRLRRELITATCRFVNHRVPVLVGITDTSIEEAVSLARHAAEAQADAVVSSAPYYLPLVQEELAGYIRQLARETPLPLMLYNMPAMTKMVFEPETLRSLLDVQNVIGIKDSSGDLSYFSSIVEVAKARPEWRIFMGPELLLTEALRRGGHGGVNGGALIDPGLLVALYRAGCDRDQTLVAALESRLRNLGRIFEVGKAPSCGIAALKHALSLMGVCSEVPAMPLMRLGAIETSRVRAILEDLGIAMRRS